MNRIRTPGLPPAIVGFLVGATSADSIRIRVPQEAPTGLPAIVAVPFAPAGDRAPAGPLIFQAGAPLPAGTPVQYVPDLDAKGQPTGHGTLYLPLTVAPGMRGRTFDIPLTPPVEPPPARLHLKVLPDQATQFYDGQRLVMQYNHGPKAPEGEKDPDPVIDFVHPIFGLDGEILTENQPRDHFHHRGLFWAWARLKHGEKVCGDWWARQDVRYHLGRIIRREAGPVLATITAEGYWDYQTKDMPEAQRLVREVATIRLYTEGLTGPADYQAFDVDIDLYAMVDNLTLSGRESFNKGYGGFTMRLPGPDPKAPKPNAKATRVQVTADGKVVPKDSNMYRAYWADYTGDFPKASKGLSGAAIFTHPDHPGSPPPWCLRYYGPLNPSWPGLQFVALHKDRPIRLSYRVVLHRGDAKTARLADLYRLYASAWAPR